MTKKERLATDSKHSETGNNGGACGGIIGRKMWRELEGEVLARVTLARFQVRHEQESKRDKGCCEAVQQ